jgi:hypothetical protein
VSHVSTQLPDSPISRNFNFKNSFMFKRQCCLALRNSISRNKALGDKLLELRAEEILRKILNQTDSQCHDEVKSVLRDLGCQVELKELWTGSGKKLDY